MREHGQSTCPTETNRTLSQRNGTTRCKRMGGVEVHICIFVTFAPAEGEWPASRAGRFVCGTRWRRAYMGSGAGLQDNMENWKLFTVLERKV
jgi:hypothetical protein